jgi:hypothetical protein
MHPTDWGESLTSHSMVDVKHCIFIEKMQSSTLAESSGFDKFWNAGVIFKDRAVNQFFKTLPHFYSKRGL